MQYKSSSESSSSFYLVVHACSRSDQGRIETETESEWRHSWTWQMLWTDFIWGIALTGMGIARWTEASFVKGLIIAAAPWVLIFGVWAAIV